MRFAGADGWGRAWWLGRSVAAAAGWVVSRAALALAVARAALAVVRGVPRGLVGVLAVVLVVLGAWLGWMLGHAAAWWVVEYSTGLVQIGLLVTLLGVAVGLLVAVGRDVAADVRRSRRIVEMRRLRPYVRAKRARRGAGGGVGCGAGRGAGLAGSRGCCPCGGREVPVEAAVAARSWPGCACGEPYVRECERAPRPVVGTARVVDDSRADGGQEEGGER